MAIRFIVNETWKSKMEIADRAETEKGLCNTMQQPINPRLTIEPSMGRDRRLVRTIVCSAILTLLAGGGPCYGEPKLKPGQGYLQGYVTDNGKPVSCVQLIVMGPPYEQKNDWAVPIVTRRVVGVIGGSFSSTTILYGGAGTDKKGHYEVVLPAGDFWMYTKRGCGKQNVPLIRRPVEVGERKGTTQDFDIGLKWHAAESAVDEFDHGLKAVLASAKEEAPLTSLVGDYTPEFLMSRVVLPGADTCAIFMVSQIPAPGGTVSLPYFDCMTSYASHDAALADYGALVKLVAAATGLTPAPAKSPSRFDTDFAGGSLIAGDSISVVIAHPKDGSILLSVLYSTLGRADLMRDKKP
jgi:hypothetical protein